MKRKYTKIDRKRYMFVAGCLAIPILQFLIFFVYMNFNTIILAFTDYQGNFTLNNFVTCLDEWKNPTWQLPLRDSIFRSVYVWGIDILMLPINVLVAFALYKKVVGYKVFYVLFYLPAIIGSVIMTTLFRYTMDGPISELLHTWGWISDELYQSGFFFGEASFTSIMIYHIWISLAGNMIVLIGAMTRVPESVLESAKLDGVSFLREFFQIIVPLIWPTISTLLIYKLGTIFLADGGTFLLTGVGNREASTGSYYLFNILYEMSQTGELTRAHYPSALGILMTLATFPIVLVLRNFIEKHTDAIEY